MSRQLDAAINAAVAKLQQRQAEAKQNVGRGKLDVARGGKDQFGMPLSNKDRLALSKSGTKDWLGGVMDKNQALRDNQTTDSNN